MRIRRVLFVSAAITVIFALIPMAGSRARQSSVASPFLKIGPQAIPADISGPNYGLFQCQVGLSAVTCYDPYQIRHAYRIDTLIAAGLTGKGKTIVIVDAYQSPKITQELNFYDTFYSLPGLNGLGAPFDPSLGTFSQIAPDGLTPFVAGDPNMTGWAEEISLDVLWAHAIAPGANIVLVLAKSNQDADILSATEFAVDHDLGDVVSQSFGENEACADPALLAQEHQLFAKATLKHMTLFASAGDSGSAQPTCDNSALVLAASTPATDPLVTAVGGTELHAAGYCLVALGCDPARNPVRGTYEGEIVWNEPAIGAGGGGFSVLYDEPSYQEGTIHGGKQRGEPDVSYSAAVEHGLLTYLNIPGLPVGMYLFGGTSAGSPQWAAILAIADQKVGYNLGFINKALYHVGQAPRHESASFFDVTIGNNAFGGIPGFSAGPGWDAASGLGSPMTDGLIDFLIQFVSAGDGIEAVNGSKPHPGGKPPAAGHMGPH